MEVINLSDDRTSLLIMIEALIVLPEVVEATTFTIETETPPERSPKFLLASKSNGKGPISLFMLKKFQSIAIVS